MSLLVRLLGGGVTLTVTAADANVQANPPLLSYTFVVPAMTGTVAAVAPSISETLVVPAATATATTVAPNLALTFAVQTAEASIVGGEVILTGAGLVASTAEATVEATPPLLSITLPAPTLIASGDVIAFDPTLEITYSVPASQASIAGGEIGIDTGGVTPPPVTVGGGGGMFQRSVYHPDLNLEAPAMRVWVRGGVVTLRIVPLEVEQDFLEEELLLVLA